MLVFWKQRLVFLAVPKTGTSAWASALAPLASMVISDPPELKHAPLYRYNRFIRPMLDKVGAGGMETLAVVREPVDWLGSWYRYRQRPFLDGRPESTARMTFDAFVQAYCQGDRPAFAEVGSQAKFLEPRPNGVAVNHVFAYEAQTALIRFLESRLEMPIAVARENASQPATLALPDETERRLRRKFAADFDLWQAARRQ
ncbi:MAG: gamma-glutamyl kinase [Roseivivax sp.]|nr:gamma-glutamyl kinase [Roseivivax sp.]